MSRSKILSLCLCLFTLAACGSPENVSQPPLGTRLAATLDVGTERPATAAASATPVPPTDTATPILYTVRPGDTLLAIASRTGVSVEQLQAANSINDPRILQIGQQLVIPPIQQSPAQGQAAEASTPLATDPPTLTPTVTPTATSTPSPCPAGCIKPPAGCDIKGSISKQTGEKIYYLPGTLYHFLTVMNTNRGDRWFCTEQEAIANGWRKSRR